MPYCPSCHFEYRSGVTRCPDCGSELVADLPKAPESQPAGDWVVVYTARDEMEANIVRGVLEDAGVPVMKQAGLGGIYPITAGPLAEEDVAVPQHWEERAKALLKEHLEGSNEWDWPDES